MIESKVVALQPYPWKLDQCLQVDRIWLSIDHVFQYTIQI